MSPRAGAAFAVEGGRPFVGRVRVPGDKSISHRALMLGALAEGTSVLRGRSDGEDVRHTEAAVRALGAQVEGESIRGGDGILHQPNEPLDFGNSGTGMRLMSGLVAGWPWTVEMCGDASLSTRPMDRVAQPLRLMGAVVEGWSERCLPPLVVRGGDLEGIDYTPPMASAQVKSCVLFAGLRARGPTVVREPVLTRTHSEELLSLCGADISESIDDTGAHVVRLIPGKLDAFELDVPGDPSQAAFWVVAACLVPGSDLVVEQVYTGPARAGFVDVLGRMRARVELVEESRSSGTELTTTSDLRAQSSTLVATEIHASEIPSLDEVPVLAVAAARAEGTTAFRNVGELRIKESDRLAGVVEMVRGFGAKAEADGDDLYVTGVPALTPAHFDARGDHRLAMAAAVAAATIPERPSRILGWESVNTSYPSFRLDLAHLTGGGP